MQPPFDIIADMDTPVSAYRKLAAFKPRFLLESVEHGNGVGRRSFIGLDSAMEIRLEKDAFYADGERYGPAATRDELLTTFRELVAKAPPLTPDADGVPFTGGLVGATGYNAVQRFEPTAIAASAHQESDEPLGLYTAPKSLLIFDHRQRVAALLHSGPEWERRQLRDQIIRALHGPSPERSACAGYSTPEPSIDKAAFLERVREAQTHIAAGDIFQAVLSVRFTGECRADPFEVYRALRVLNPSPYMYYLDFGNTQIAGSSPEALVRVEGNTASLRPIAGTRPRGVDRADDAAMERSLLADPKEAAEHVMLVDLARNDLGRVGTPGSVRVEPYRSIERYSHVMHIVSGVSTELAPGKDGFDALASAFPAGTLSGAPKVRAAQIIDALEPVGRGFYGGAVGYFDRHGGMDQAITIRTVVFQQGKYTYQAGAGIVADSDPSHEHDEVLAKVGALEAALRLTEQGLDR